MRCILLMRTDEAVQVGETHTTNAGKDEAVQAGETHTANDGKDEAANANAGKDVAATNTDFNFPPSMRFIVPHAVRSQLAYWHETTEYGASFRAMSYDEQLAEVEKLNRGPEDDDEDLTSPKNKAKKSISKFDGDTEDDDEDEDPEGSEEDELTPVKKQPTFSKIRGRQHRLFSPAGNCSQTLIIRLII